ncbi:hypothetical protein HEK616_75000 (plasmid) [Streptomyces nigrescens]|uniref:Uncharacterized protein n=2 Tax=Streptomyces TaxID=1883 RepID=A0ABN6RA48_STRNI|nr:hypothetical protein [Streptomyces nigrescens]MEE4419257.1 hypothetical protein [Streptomyces sp. DSM 41528]BDM74013.1 hypothetical protein HEK616_75000 [Streptomyces nigrescens]
MERDQDTGTRGLSTEDLAAPPPSSTPAPASMPPPMPDEATAPAGDVPTAPGESVPIPGETAETEGTGRGTPATGAPPVEEAAPQLLTADDAESFRDRWQGIQATFVDDPREAVHAADALVAEVMQTLATTFAEHKQSLEEQWKQGEKVDTEGLRVALRQYRSFFHRLLAE